MAFLVLSIVLGLGCQGTTPPSEILNLILVIGIDGAEWNVLTPMLERGELPNLTSLIDGGAAGRLRSLEPAQGSPVIWTTIATGRPPGEHGIKGFLADGETKMAEFRNTPYSSNMWKASAIWDIIGRAGRRVAVVGWLVSWPAWEVNGTMVSQHAQLVSGLDRTGGLARSVWPEEAAARIRPYVRTSTDISEDEFERFVNSESELGLASLDGYNEDVLRRALSGDQTILDVTLSLAAEELPYLTCMYMRGIDEMCHRFWTYRDPSTWPPADPGNPLSARLALQVDALDGAVEEFYRYVDENVGRILEAFPDDTRIVVCSDHGFRGPGQWGSPEFGTGIKEHSPEGVIILNGPGIASGVTLEGASVHDVAPTILTLAGLPVGRDMSGKVLTEALSPEFARSMPVRYVDTYETGVDAATGEEPIESPVDEEVREQLRALGYIE
jgi:predicted AlkP superfamily phosphohydrolase/phosphomutase